MTGQLSIIDGHLTKLAGTKIIKYKIRSNAPYLPAKLTGLKSWSFKYFSSKIFYVELVNIERNNNISPIIIFVLS